MRRKPCKECGDLKTLRHFYRHPHCGDGRMNTCKVCWLAQVEANRELKFEQYRETKRLWSARPENVAKRRAYRRSARGTAVHHAAQRRYRRFLRIIGRAKSTSQGTYV